MVDQFLQLPNHESNHKTFMQKFRGRDLIIPELGLVRNECKPDQVEHHVGIRLDDLKEIMPDGWSRNGTIDLREVLKAMRDKGVKPAAYVPEHSARWRIEEINESYSQPMGAITCVAVESAAHPLPKIVQISDIIDQDDFFLKKYNISEIYKGGSSVILIDKKQDWASFNDFCCFFDELCFIKKDFLLVSSVLQSYPCSDKGLTEGMIKELAARFWHDAEHGAESLAGYYYANREDQNNG